MNKLLLKKTQAYVLAIIFVLAALLARVSLEYLLVGELASFTALVCAIVLSAWVGGLGPGLLATLLGTLAAGLILSYDLGGYQVLTEPINMARVGIFAITGLLISGFSARTHHALSQAEERQTLLEHEIGERHQAEETLKKREELYRAVFDQQFQFMVILDPDGRLVNINDMPLKNAGITREQVVGRHLWETPWWAGIDNMKTLWQRRLHDAAAASSSVTCEDKFTINGQMRVCDCAVTAVKNPDGKVNLFIVQASDQTERKRAEAALRDSEHRFRMIADTMPQIVWSTLPDGNLDYFNYRWYEYTGMTQGSLDWADIIHPDDIDYVLAARELSVETGEPFEVECRYRRHDGVYNWFIVRALPLRDDDGDVTHWYGTSTDITDLREAMEKAEEGNRAKTEFLAKMSHEIRTPMNAVVGLSNILHNHVLPPDKQREFIKTLQLSAQSLLGLINDLLDVTKLQGEEVELERIPFNLPELIDEVVDIVSVRAKEKNLDLKVTYDKNLTEYLIGDPLRIRQILMNLVSNAVKFTEKGGVSVDITASRNQGTGMMDIRFDVSDTGIGIPEDKIGTIFSKFAQADTSITRKYGGTGLGLSITKTLVEMMGGTIDVVSTPGLGSKFTVKISLTTTSPSLSPSPEAAGAELREEDFFPTHMTLDEFQPTILLAEDYRGNVLVATATIEDCGYNWELAENGREALDMIRHKNYDLVLMDVQMPEMDGISATRAIRDLEKKLGRRHVPIIGVTAYSLKGDKEKCLDAGMDDYMAKPFNPLELKGKIQTLLKTGSH